MNNEFLTRIQSYIPDEFDEFEKSLSNDMYKGLRVNTKKLDVDSFSSQVDFEVQKAPFSKNGFYVNESLGLHPFHISGSFYLQEPSASSVVSVMDVQPDDTVLDLCAAPGGKSTQIAEQLSSEGFLVSNEIEPKRSRILLSNFERMGVMNMMITNDSPERLCSSFESCFDKILVDAPCSGEGMMKKHDVAKDAWSIERIQECSHRQKNILTQAYKSLKKDGYLIYSTCTYAKEENEDIVEWFLNSFEDIELVPIDVDYGRPGFIEGTRRIFPMDGGEGHFIAKFHKKDGEVKTFKYFKDRKYDSSIRLFLLDQLGFLPLYIRVEKDKIYAMEHPFIDYKNVRQGIYVGDLKKNRIEPSHAFYLNASWIHDYCHVYDVTKEELDLFMHGQQLDVHASKGYLALTYKNIPFAFGKSDGNRITNKVPKGIRLLPNSHVL